MDVGRLSSTIADDNNALRRKDKRNRAGSPGVPDGPLCVPNQVDCFDFVDSSGTASMRLRRPVEVQPTMTRYCLFPILFALVACGDDAVPTTSAGEGGSASESSSSSSASGSGGAGSGGTGGASNGGSGGASGSDVVPSDPAALFTYLQSKKYTGFAGESAIHPSTGPHGGSVRTFVNAALNASLAANNAEHPKGAASVSLPQQIAL
jgi:hypothetical protein